MMRPNDVGVGGTYSGSSPPISATVRCDRENSAFHSATNSRARARVSVVAAAAVIRATELLEHTDVLCGQERPPSEQVREIVAARLQALAPHSGIGKVGPSDAALGAGRRDDALAAVVDRRELEPVHLLDLALVREL